MNDNILKVRKKKKIFSFIIAIITFLLVYILFNLEFFQNFERKTYDYRLKIRGNRKVSKKIVIVFIGNETLKKLGYPLPREHYAAIINCLKELGARSIVLDVLFSQTDYKEKDLLLLRETKKAGNVFAPIYFYLSRKEFLYSTADNTPEENKIPENELYFFHRKTNFYRAVSAELPFKNFQLACKGLGHVNVNPDPDGITRKIPLLIEYDGWLYPSLSFITACDYFGLSNDDIIFNNSNKITLNIPGDKSITIPLNKKGELYINYSGNIGNFENYSFLQVLQAYKYYLSTGNPAYLSGLDLRTFKDKIVLIGLTALGTHDVHSTPFDNKYALVGVHANVIDSILSNQLLFDAPEWVNFLISFLLTLLIAYIIPRYNFKKSLLIIFSTYIIIMILIVISFMLFGIVFKMFTPTITLFLSILFISMSLIRIEELEKLKSEREKLNITKKLWGKEKELHSIYDKLIEKEKSIEKLRQELQVTIDESSNLKNEYLEKIKQLEEEKERLINKQAEISYNKQYLENELQILESNPSSNTKQPPITRENLKGNYDFIIGNSPKLMEVLYTVDKAASTMTNIMITGPTGSGKELLAKAIHLNSPRAKGPFVAVNCAAIPKDLIEGELFGFEKGAFTGAITRHIGKFEQANKGTIFLDEIGDMSLDTQAKVLRAIQEKVITRIGGKNDIKIDVRIITATHKDLKQEIENKTFRADLFFRLNVIPIYLPPLNERKEDIPLLIEHFIEKYKKEMGLTKKIKISPQAMMAFVNYSWPGNIRELENTVQRILTLKDDQEEFIIDINDLPEEILGKSPNFELEGTDSLFAMQSLKEAVEEFERQFLVYKLNQFNWNKSKTAEYINLGRRNLHKKIKKYNISEEKDKIPEIEF